MSCTRRSLGWGISEERSIAVSAPDKDGSYSIEWVSVFTASEDVLLDRTPIEGEKNGVNWGGYAGLSLRMSESTKGWQFVGSEGVLARETRGAKARWVDCSGEGTGVTIYDDPDNLRHPASWWVSGYMPLMAPSPLFEAPYTMAKGESLTLRYRIAVHAGKGKGKGTKNVW